MAALVKVLTKPTGVRHNVGGGNLDVRYFDLTSDTGDYAAGGITITAAEVGLKTVKFVSTSGGVATQGTAGASGVGVGITYASEGTSFVVWLYEVDTAADGAPFQQKGNEAMASNFTIRLRIEGY